MADFLGDFAKSLVSVSSTSLNTVNGVINFCKVPFLYGGVRNLFVRSCYVDLAGLILRENRDSQEKQFVVSGSPGMGKSCFGLYMLAKLVNECGAKIIHYQTELFGKYTFTINDDQIPQFAKVYDPLFFEQSLDNSPTGSWYIVDGIKPHGVEHVNTLLITSPRKSIWHHFQKQSKAAMYYVPIWSWDELQLCHTLIYSDIVSEDVVNMRFSKWGGNARYIFSTIKQEVNNNTKFDEAIQGSETVESFILPIGNQDRGKGDVSHALMHYIVNVDDDDECKRYKRYHFAPASNYVFSILADSLLDRMHQQVVAFLSVDSYGRINDPTSVFRGHLFEKVAHKYLMKGGKFSVRSLQKTNIEETVIQPAESVERFSSWPSQLKPGVYYQPMSSNFPVIDAFRCCSSHEVILFQMTIATRHPIVHQELKDTISRFEGQGYTVKRLYFVVPDSKFASFPLQTYHTKQKTITERVDSRVKAVEQYALQISLRHVLPDELPEPKRPKTDCD